MCETTEATEFREFRRFPEIFRFPGTRDLIGKARDLCVVSPELVRIANGAHGALDVNATSVAMSGFETSRRFDRYKLSSGGLSGGELMRTFSDR